MNAKDQQPQLDGIPPETEEKPHMISRVSALAVKLAFPFMAQKDIRFYLCGVNIRPLEDGTVMIVATNGHRYIVVRDSNGFAERELIVAVSKDGLKHCAEGKHSLDVLSNGTAMISGKVAEPLFIQPGNSLIEGDFPRIERVADIAGYKEGISGAVNPAYLADALTLSDMFAAVRFFTRDADSPLMFVYGGLSDLECFGGIMKMRDAFDSLPQWFPRPTEPSNLAQI